MHSILFSIRCFAFSPEGHEVIEASSYKFLIENELEINGQKINGKEVLKELIEKGYLYDPLQAPLSETSNGDQIVLPVIGSGTPDLIASRQLSNRGQCYHFMASVKDVYESESITTSGYPIKLAKDAYKRCILLMTAMTERIIDDPLSSHLSYQNVYAMIHLIVDSFSDAHVIRDENGGIEILKAWRLTGLFSYLFHWQGWEYFSTNTHHAIKDDFDEQYAVGKCGKVNHPLKMESECLTKNGLDARDAVVDYLVLLWELDKINNEEDVRLEENLDAKEIWDAYLEKYFKSNEITDPSFITYEKELDWRPTLNLGIQNYDGNYGIKYEQYFEINASLPLEFGISIEYIQINNGFGFIISQIPNVRIGVTENFTLTFKPFLSSEIHHDDGISLADTNSAVEMGFYFDERYWISLNRTVGSDIDLLDGASVTLGLTFDLDDFSKIDWLKRSENSVKAPNGHTASIEEFPNNFKLDIKLESFKGYKKDDNYFFYGGYNASIDRYIGIGMEFGSATYQLQKKHGLRNAFGFAVGVGDSTGDFKEKTVRDLYPEGDEISSDLSIYYEIGNYIYKGKLFLGYKPIIGRMEGFFEDEKIYSADSGFEIRYNIVKDLVFSLELPFIRYDREPFEMFGSIGLKIGKSI